MINTKRNLKKRTKHIIMLANLLGDAGQEVLARHAVVLLGTYAGESNKQMSLDLDHLQLDLDMVCLNPRAYTTK